MKSSPPSSVYSSRVFIFGLLFEKAELLVQENSDRYKPLFEQEDKNVYVRRRGDYIVELVYFAKEEEGALQIVNLTGYMDENFIARLLKI